MNNKIYISGLSANLSELVIMDRENHRINVTWKKVYLRGFYLWVQEKQLEYFGNDLSLAKLLFLTLQVFFSRLRRSSKFVLKELFVTYEGTLVDTHLICFPIRITNSRTKSIFWISRHAIINGVSSDTYGPEIQYEIIRRPKMYMGFIWAMTDKSRIFPRKLDRNRLLATSKLQLIQNLQIDCSLHEKMINFKTIENCTVFNGLLAVKNKVVHYTSHGNSVEPVTWPTNLASSIFGDYSIINGISILPEDIPIAVLYGSSENWYHFLIEILPNLIKFSSTDNAKKVLLLKGEPPANIKQIADTFGFKQVIFMRDGEKIGVNKLEITTDLRTSSLSDITNREQDIFLVRNFLLRLGNTSSQSKLLYVARDRNLFRTLRQREILESRLIQLGFRVIYPELLDLETEIEYFRNAQLVVAETGAALTNIIMMPKGSHVIEITGGNNNLLWKKLSSIIGINHNIIYGSPTIVAKVFTHDGEFKIDINKSISIIEEVVRKLNGH